MSTMQLLYGAWKGYEARRTLDAMRPPLRLGDVAGMTCQRPLERCLHLRP